MEGTKRNLVWLALAAAVVFIVFQAATCSAGQRCKPVSFWDNQVCGAKDIGSRGDVPKEVWAMLPKLLEKNRNGCDKKMVGGHIFLVRVKYHRPSDRYQICSVEITKGGVRIYYHEEKICEELFKQRRGRSIQTGPSKFLQTSQQKVFTALCIVLHIFA